jgi:methylmalonyl-CoA/ethylmalonyl-CoA epimerase
METQVHLDTIGQIALTVSDLAAAKQFYGDVLGMAFLFDAGTMAFYQCGTVRLMIGLAETPGPVGGTILYFKVDDIEATHTALVERKVEFVHAPRMVAKMPDHDLWLGFLKDPSGNTIGLMSEVRA